MRWPDKKKTSYEDEETEQMYLEKMLREIQRMDTEKIYNELLVKGAVMACEYGRISKDSLSFAYCGFDEILTDNTIQVSGPFGICHSPNLVNDPNRKKQSLIIRANESITGQGEVDSGPRCEMEISQQWLGTTREIVIWDSQAQIERTIPTTTSYLICHCGGGCIFPVNSGQKTETKKGDKEFYISPKGVQLLKYFEFPTDAYQTYKHLYYIEGREIVGVYPHYVGDEGITFGYGHCIKREGRYENNNEEILKRYISSDIEQIKYDDGIGKEKYPRLAGSIPVLFTDADVILDDDLKRFCKKVENELRNKGIEPHQYEQHQIDAIIIRSFPFGEVTKAFRTVLSQNMDQDGWNRELGFEGADSKERTIECGDLFYKGDYFIKGKVPFEEKHTISDKFWEKYFQDGSN